MNKIVTVALIAGGLLLLDAPEAAAHKEVRNSYQPPAYYHLEARRGKHMPLWLKRNRSFRHWYKHTRLRRDRRLAWHQLFNIYRWERSALREHRRGHRRHYVTLDFDYYRDRDRDRDRKERRRHRH